MSMNIFERAARAQLRFSSGIGQLTAENLFELPLAATGNRASLDRLACETYNELQALGAVSFVDAKPNPRKTELELKLEIIKHVIASKQAEAAAAETKAKNVRERERLLEVLAKKKDAQLEGLSEEEILKKLEEIGAPA